MKVCVGEGKTPLSIFINHINPRALLIYNVYIYTHKHTSNITGK